MRREVISAGVLTLVVTCLSSFSASDAIAQGGSWSAHAQLPNPRVGAPAGVIDGKLHVVSGCCVVVGFPHTRFTDMRIYDPVTDSWTLGTPIPTGVYLSGTGVINGKLYVAGGQVPFANVDTLQIYDSATQAWSAGPPMPGGASSAVSAGVINGKLYVAGGTNASNTGAVGTLRIFDPATNQWTVGTSMPTPRSSGAAAVLDGRLYVIGGHRPGVATYADTVEAYDPVSDTWAAKPSVPTARYGAAAAVVQGIIYAVGGYNGSFLATVEAYDPAANEWSTQDPMPNVHYAAAAGVLDERFHVVSGQDATGFVGLHDAFNAPVLNTPPTANAGPDQATRPGAATSLDGSASFDDNTPSAQLLYQWSFLSIPPGSMAALQDADSATPTFVADVFGDYVIALTVTDEGGLHSVSDEVIVGTDVPPTANAGPDRLVVVGTPVTLDGSGFDPDDTNLGFSWTLVETPSGSGASLSNAQTEDASFVPDVPGAYVAELIVSDSLGGGTPDQVHVTAVTAASYAQTRTQDAAESLSALPASVLTTEGNRNALMNFLSQAVSAMQSGDLEEARNRLQQAISRTDGCAARGTPDGSGPGRDWITTCAAQGPVYSSLLDALAAIQ